MSAEERRSERIPVREHLVVTDTMSDAPLGRIGNLSDGGMLLITETALPEEALFQLRFPLGEGGPPLDIGAQAMWVEAARTAGSWWVGFRIIDIAEADQQRLDAWLDELVRRG
ncbi:MAG: PilZ domain-containing protein [Xanthomonadales bacterium]|jgi:hypothetical protein|nr:PilZ domain-containing protein [Xanthomonadales bacterium]